MNILYLVHRIPLPPDKGDKLRSFRQFEHLTRRHRVWCACFVDTPSDTQYVKPLRGYCKDVAAIRLKRAPAMLRGVAGLARGKTLTESFYSHAAMRAALRKWCDSIQFDVVVAFSSSMAPYALEVPAARRVLDLCDLDSRKWLDYAAVSHGPARWLYRTEGHRLALKERAWLNAFDATFVITESEAAPLQGAAPPGKLHIIGNGVSLPDPSGNGSRIGNWGLPIGDWGLGYSGAPTDHRQSTIDNPQSAIPNRKSVRESSLRSTVGFVGVMDYRPNVDAVCWFVSNCWREIRAACPEAVFRIVGRSPTQRVHKLANVPGVQVVGGVEDVTSEVRRFDVSVAPMRIARGLQNKVLEAMAVARPVVLTSKAAEGIAAGHDEEYLVADRPADIVDGVVRLLKIEPSGSGWAKPPAGSLW